MALSSGKLLIGGGIGLVAFLVSYGIASASDKKKKPQTTTPSLTVKPGETIDISPVKGVQKGLIILGYNVGSTGADDKYGPATSAAVKKFNADNGGPANGIINLDFRKRLATKLRAKGYTVVGDTSASTYENTAQYSSGEGGGYAEGSTVMTKRDAYNIGCKRGSVDGKSEAVDGYESNPVWNIDKTDKTAYEAYTKFKTEFTSGYKDCYIKSYNTAKSSKPWYEEGMTVTSTGRLEPIKSEGKWGPRNDVLARANHTQVFVGKSIEDFGKSVSNSATKICRKIGLVK